MLNALNTKTQTATAEIHAAIDAATPLRLSRMMALGHAACNCCGDLTVALCPRCQEPLHAACWCTQCGMQEPLPAAQRLELERAVLADLSPEMHFSDDPAQLVAAE